MTTALQKADLTPRRRLKGRKERAEARVKKCVQCGVMFEHRDKRRPGTTCSRACYDARRAFQPYTGPCVVCGTACQPKSDSGRWRPKQKTCSKMCARRGSGNSKAGKPRKCDHCGVAYFPDSNGRLKYCSRKCYDAVLAANGWVVKPCDHCGASVRRRRQWVRARIFCGKQCQSAFFQGERAPMWREGTSLRRGKGWSRIAASIRERDGFTCRRCGKTQEENGQKLSVDHVRPWCDRESDEQANAPSNLVSLCRPCHSRKAKLERRWLLGDGTALQDYRRSVGLIA